MSDFTKKTRLQQYLIEAVENLEKQLDIAHDLDANGCEDAYDGPNLRNAEDRVHNVREAIKELQEKLANQTCETSNG